MSNRTVITVGNFDGVHVGHGAMLAEARRLGERYEAEVVAVTFSEHPLTLLKPTAAPPLLMPRRRCLEMLGRLVGRVEVLDLTVELLKQEPGRFVAGMVERLSPVAWVEGSNFRFGRHRRGDVGQLEQMGRQMGFEVAVVAMQSVVLRDKTVVPASSSLVRWLVGGGRMADAALCLGRPYALVGQVVAGEGRGRTMGVPTANLECGRQMLPGPGVYGGWCQWQGRRYLAAVSIGDKPTFGGQRRPCCEVHLLDFEGDLYGCELEVKVVRWLRGQERFERGEDLVEQVRRDMEAVRRWEQAGVLEGAGTVCGETGR